MECFQRLFNRQQHSDDADRATDQKFGQIGRRRSHSLDLSPDLARQSSGKTEDKYFVRQSSGGKSFSAASSRGHLNEFKALRHMKRHGLPTVLAGDEIRNAKIQTRTDQRVVPAYEMQWIEGGISSNDDPRRFEQLLQEHRMEPALQDSLNKFEKYNQSHEITDFQVIFDPQSKRLFAHDPKELKPRPSNGRGIMETRLSNFRRFAPKLTWKEYAQQQLTRMTSCFRCNSSSGRSGFSLSNFSQRFRRQAPTPRYSRVSSHNPDDVV